MIHTQPPRRPDATAQQPYDLKMLLSNVDSLLPNGYLAIYSRIVNTHLYSLIDFIIEGLLTTKYCNYSATKTQRH